jgi:DNA-binding response OmpR family regulator
MWPAPICIFCDEEAPLTDDRYIPLLSLAGEWARDSSMPQELVLRRLCEWAAAGGFPEGAFVTSTGDNIPPLDLLTALRAIVGNGHATVGGWIVHIEPLTAMNQLKSALVSGRHVLSFCERTNTIPPPSLCGKLKRLLARRDRRMQIAPPECPNVDAQVATKLARQRAVDALVLLRRHISSLRHEQAIGPVCGEQEPGNIDYWKKRWAKISSRARADLRTCDDKDLQQELDALELEWESLAANHSSVVGGEAEKLRVAPDAGTLASTTAEIGEATIAEPRLRIWRRKGRVRLDGFEPILTPRSFRLLEKLTAAAVESPVPVPNCDLKKLVDGSGDKAVAQGVYQLKQELIRGGIAGDRVQTLIENVRANGYRLTLSAADIQSDD